MITKSKTKCTITYEEPLEDPSEEEQFEKPVEQPKPQQEAPQETVYLRHKETNEVVKFEANSRPADIENWVKATKKEVEELEFKQLKNAKFVILNDTYHSTDLWRFTIKDTQGNSLTHEQNWLLLKVAKDNIFKSDNGEFIDKKIDDPDALKTKINKKGVEILQMEQLIKSKIDNATTKAQLDKIDIDKEFAKINKTIEIE